MNRLVVLLILACFLFINTAAKVIAADLWRCDDKLYTNITREGAPPGNCELLKNQVVCGKEGNKYFSPFRNGIQDSSSTCEKGTEVNTQNSSPLVNMKFVEAFKDYKALPSKKFAEKTTTPELSTPDAMSNLPGLNVLPEVMNIVKGIQSGADAAFK